VNSRSKEAQAETDLCSPHPVAIRGIGNFASHHGNAVARIEAFDAEPVKHPDYEFLTEFTDIDSHASTSVDSPVHQRAET
jgi:hypothetical protein